MDDSRRKQSSGGRIVCGQALIREQVPVAGIEEKLSVFRSSRQFAGGMEIGAGKPLVRFHRVNLNGYAVWPGSAKLSYWNAGVKQQRTPGARSRLRQFLGRQNSQ